MRYALAGEFTSPWLGHMAQGIHEVMQRHGHVATDDPQEAELVFHAVSTERPRPFRRQHRATFVVGLAEGEEHRDPLRAAYPTMIRSISNLLVYGGMDAAGGPWAYLTTPELGCYRVQGEAADLPFFDSLYERIRPLATSHLVIDNVFDEDLPEELAEGTPVCDQMREAARTLDKWNLFPAPYPIAELLPPEDYRHIRHLFGIGGLSYGNLSARHDRHRFWMTASGVDKGKVGEVSRDILLVKGYDPEVDAIRLSVRPGSRPLRVSVDAIEHWRVYEDHPEIGAMVHVHAWVDGVRTTEANYPCGTVEMGVAMSRLFAEDPHPERTIIGLRNHGITATGPNFPDILERLEGRIRTQVPMV